MKASTIAEARAEGRMFKVDLGNGRGAGYQFPAAETPAEAVGWAKAEERRIGRQMPEAVTVWRETSRDVWVFVGRFAA